MLLIVPGRCRYTLIVPEDPECFIKVVPKTIKVVPKTIKVVPKTMKVVPKTKP